MKFFTLQETETPKKLIFSQKSFGGNFQSSKIEKTHSYFLGEPLGFFYHCFFRCFHFTVDFYYYFWVFSLLISFVNFTVFSGFFISPLILLMFYECSALNAQCSVFSVKQTVFSKRYQLVGSIYLLRPYGTLYQLLPGFEKTI